MSKSFIVVVLMLVLLIIWVKRDKHLDSEPSTAVPTSTATVAVAVAPVVAPVLAIIPAYNRDSLAVWSDPSFIREMISALEEIVEAGARPGEGVIAFTSRVASTPEAQHFDLKGLNLSQAIALANEHGAPVIVHWDDPYGPQTIEAPVLAVGTQNGWRLGVTGLEIRGDGSRSVSFSLQYWRN